jgi:hypothetical protein
MRVAAVALLIGVVLASACSAPVGEPRGTLPTLTPATATATLGATPAAFTPAPTEAAISVGGITGQTLPTPPPDTVWVLVSDPSAPITYEVPSTYGYSAVYPWQENNTDMGVLLAAGTNTAQIGTDFSAPGVLMGISANPIGMTPMTLVTEDDYSDRCTATAAQAGAEPNVTSAFRTWESCGVAKTGYVLLLGIVPQDGRGLIAMLLQGASDADLAYVQHIVASLQSVDGSGGTPGPGGTPQPGDTQPPGETPPAGQPYTITMDICRNQHGQGVAEGELTNSDSVPHVYRILVEFWQQGTTTKLNDTRSFAYSLNPGVTQRWQAVVASGLPSVDVECRVTEVNVQ